MSEISARPANPPAGILLVWIAGIVSVAAFFRHQILDGFTLLFSDRFDGLIVTAIMQPIRRRSIKRKQSRPCLDGLSVRS